MSTTDGVKLFIRIPITKSMRNKPFNNSIEEEKEKEKEEEEKDDDDDDDNTKEITWQSDINLDNILHTRRKTAPVERLDDEYLLKPVRTFNRKRKRPATPISTVVEYDDDDQLKKKIKIEKLEKRLELHESITKLQYEILEGKFKFLKRRYQSYEMTFAEIGQQLNSITKSLDLIMKKLLN
jgi:hypothetical protein